jgi:general secretion pathway protein J
MSAPKKTHVRRADAQAGFTLAETLVAMFVFALLATSGVAVLTQTLQGKERLEQETAELAQLAALHAALKADIGQAAARTARDRDGAPIGFAGGLTDPDPALLSLTRAGWANPGGVERRSSLIAVTYILRDGALVRRAMLRPDAAPGTPVRERVLIDGVRSAQLRFLARGVWSDVWVQGARGAALPEAVELTLDTEAAGPLRLMFLTGAGAGSAGNV